MSNVAPSTFTTKFVKFVRTIRPTALIYSKNTYYMQNFREKVYGGK